MVPLNGIKILDLTRLIPGGYAMLILADLGGEILKIEDMDFTGRFPCYGIYETEDSKYVAFAALEEKFWKNFCLVTGREDLVQEQYDESGETKRDVENAFKSKTRAQWEEASEKFDLCLEPVLNFKETIEHPQLENRNLLFDINHQNMRIPQVKIPFLMSEVEETPRSPAPLWSEHTEGILISLGIDREEIESLKKGGVV